MEIPDEIFEETGASPQPKSTRPRKRFPFLLVLASIVSLLLVLLIGLITFNIGDAIRDAKIALETRSEYGKFYYQSEDSGVCYDYLSNRGRETYCFDADLLDEDQSELRAKSLIWVTVLLVTSAPSCYLYREGRRGWALLLILFGIINTLGYTGSIFGLFWAY